jgi:hypothetical protein
LAVVVGACADAGAPDAQEEALVDQDVARYVADATADDIALMNTEADRASSTIMQSPGDCIRDQGRIRCTREAWDGSLTIEREITFYDADDLEQDRYDAELTASINFYFSLEGERSRNGLTVTVGRERDFTVSGLEGAETQRTWNGTGSAVTNRTRTSDERGTRTYDMSSRTVVEDVVVLVPREGTWPQSGTITRNVTAEIVNGLGDTRTRERTVVITFNGTQFVTMTMNGDRICELDLATRDVSCSE